MWNYCGLGSIRWASFCVAIRLKPHSSFDGSLKGLHLTSYIVTLPCEPACHDMDSKKTWLPPGHSLPQPCWLPARLAMRRGVLDPWPCAAWTRLDGPLQCFLRRVAQTQTCKRTLNPSLWLDAKYRLAKANIVWWYECGMCLAFEEPSCLRLKKQKHIRQEFA